MDRFLSHVLRGLVAVLGLASTLAHAQCAPGPAPTRPGGTFPDEGLAFERCQQDNARAFYLVSGTTLFRETPIACTRSTGLFRPSFTRAEIITGTCTPRSESGATTGPNDYRFTNTCTTRPDSMRTWTGGHDVLACDRGCDVSSVGAFGVSVCTWSGPAGARVFTCGGRVRATGTICEQGPDVTDGPPPPDPDRDGDGSPNPDDGAPDDPGCQVNCGPQPPPPPPPPPQPPPPDDRQDDGAQIGQELGPALDAIEQAVLGLGPQLTVLAGAIEGARADANADADGMRSALDGIRSAIVAQGPNGGGDGTSPGEGDGPPDLTPLTPGNDGGEHPALSSIIEEGDANSLIAQLDVDGWALTRSCPAYSWPLSFDLGWGSVNIADAVDMVCGAMAILGFVIGLAGLIQAAFILSRVGGAA